MKISRSEQTPALGAAVFAAVAAGRYKSTADAQKAMVGIGKEYAPIAANHETYEKLYALYRQLHDAFGLRRMVRTHGQCDEGPAGHPRFRTGLPIMTDRLKEEVFQANLFSVDATTS
jgi:hypothetical protein